MTTNTSVITELSKKDGLILNGEFQVLPNGVTFYPRTFFSPYDYINGGNYITGNSFTIHHFAKSWLPIHVRMNSKLKRVASRVVGPSVISKCESCYLQTKSS